MNKSSLVALSLGLLAVLSCLDRTANGKPASLNCCRLQIWHCCTVRLQDSSMTAQAKRRAQATAVESSLLGNFHDTRAEVEHPDVEFIEKS